MKFKGRIITILLLVSILSGLLPIMPSTHVHASGWEECVYCGKGRSEDYLCDSCGGCGGVLEGSSCWQENHCPGCGECHENVVFCEDCWRCVSCVPNMCEEGDPHCTDCVGLEHFCESCHKCAYHLGGRYCDDHHVCEDCAQFCSECLACEECVEKFCDSCGKCQICAHDHFCDDCGDCGEHWDARCPGCEVCTNCNEDSICSDCGLVCAECALVCPDCGICEDCIGDHVCQDCGLCGDCAVLCRDCGSVCEDCAEVFCNDCELCGDCTDVCQDCNDVCTGCGDICGGCLKYCADCVDICQDCGEKCTDCGNICHDCYEVCDECVPFCKGCDECQNCRGEFCSRCEAYCPDCAIRCLDCGFCEYCVDICSTCGEHCSECVDFCPGCDGCAVCVEICELCGEHCSSCQVYECEFCDISFECKYHAYCDACKMCLNDPAHLICDDCGEHWFSHRTYLSFDDDLHSMACTCGKRIGALGAHRIKYEVLEDPTETETGLGRYSCYNCEYAHDVEIAAFGEVHDHEFDHWLPFINSHVRICACGATKEGSEQPHTYAFVVLEEATENKNGLAYDKCTVCGFSTQPYVIEASDHTHDFSTDWSYDKFTHWHACECGDKKDENYHSMGDWETTKHPTVTEAGSRERTCGICGYKEKATIPALGENLTVSFDSMGGSAVADKQVSNGGKLELPTDPTRAGYDFAGWYTSADLAEKWMAESYVYGNMTLYAKWDKATSGAPVILTDTLKGGTVGKTYSASLEAAGNVPFIWSIASGSLPAGLTLGQDGKLSGTPTGAGVFTFEIKVTNGESPDATREYTITIDPQTAYSITLDVEGSGTAMANPEAAVPGTEIALTATAQEGFVFMGYIVISGGVSIEDGKFIMPGSDVVLKAVFEEEEISSPYSYTVVEGAAATWYTDGEEGLRFVIDGDFAKFTGVEVDLAWLESANFSAEEGSVIVHLALDYLKSLADGEYEIGFVFEHIEVYTTFSVAQGQASGEIPPPMGSANNTWLYAIMLAISSTALGVMLMGKKKRER